MSTQASVLSTNSKRTREMKVEVPTPKEEKKIAKVMKDIRAGKLDNFITLEERKQKNAKKLGITPQ